MRRALALAASPGVPTGPNPRVGLRPARPGRRRRRRGPPPRCRHPARRGRRAARAPGARARGATAVVTLEPCTHTGRTGPCSQALIARGRRPRRGRAARRQPASRPAGPSALREAGVEVEVGVLADEAAALNETWTFAVAHGRPFVTWKAASTLDGRIAAADGIEPLDHLGRGARRGARAAGRASTPSWSAPAPCSPTTRTSAVRTSTASVSPASQPLRVVVGRRDIPEGARVLDDAAPDPAAAHPRPGRGARGAARPATSSTCCSRAVPRSRAAFVRAGLVDAVRWYVAPALLGAGAHRARRRGHVHDRRGVAPAGHRRRARRCRRTHRRPGASGPPRRTECSPASSRSSARSSPSRRSPTPRVCASTAPLVTATPSTARRSR